MQAKYTQGGLVSLTLGADDSLVVAKPAGDDPGLVLGEGEYQISPTPGLLIWDAIMAAGLAVAPAVVTQLNFLGFMDLFTEAEQVAIANAGGQVRLFCLMAAGAAFVELSDPRVIGGVQLLEGQGLIAAGRAAQVLAGAAPPSA